MEWEEYTAAANAAVIGRHDGDEDGDDGDVISDDNDDDVVMVMILIAMMMIMGFKNLKKVAVPAGILAHDSVKSSWRS